MKLSDAIRHCAEEAILNAEKSGKHGNHAGIQAHYTAAAFGMMLADIVSMAERCEISDFPASNNIDNLG